MSKANYVPITSRSHPGRPLAAARQLEKRDVVVKIVTDVSDQSPIGGVIGRLDTDDSLLERRVVLLRISEEMHLRHRRPHQQNRSRSRERLGHLVKEAVLIVGMVVSPGLLILGMAVDVMIRRLNLRFVEGRCINVKNFRLVVIDPDRHLMRAHDAETPSKVATRRRRRPRSNGFGSTSSAPAASAL